MSLGWVANQQCRRWTTSRIWGATFLCCMCLILFTPRIPRSPKHHRFFDMRNLLGVPNTLNVMTNFPFLVVGVLGLVLVLEGCVFNISSQGEVWTWALFYAGITGVAFGSAYYHLKPDDHRVLWDTLPMMVAFSSLLSSLVVERFGQRIGLCCMFALIVAAFLCVLYEREGAEVAKFYAEFCLLVGCRIYNDIRFCMMFQFTLPLAIPVIAVMYRSKYTHSRYWFLSTGVYMLAKFEGVTDKKLYHVNNYIISGHSLEHLCLALIPVLLSIMLIYREHKFQRIDHEDAERIDDCSIAPGCLRDITDMYDRGPKVSNSNRFFLCRCCSLPFGKSRHHYGFINVVIEDSGFTLTKFEARVGALDAHLANICSFTCCCFVLLNNFYVCLFYGS
ncbi:hypothetical protein CR513_57185 [Mucuna pruriens]|uniref:Alkaline ceramidase n=1 Tax=Mucuna pruriens TaxID=157652 RepID=A0A371EE08_MUCPR|nr:hypothetical protein CR513_57185 [Mucuna pruriens]